MEVPDVKCTSENHSHQVEEGDRVLEVGVLLGVGDDGRLNDVAGQVDVHLGPVHCRQVDSLHLTDAPEQNLRITGKCESRQPATNVSRKTPPSPGGVGALNRNLGRGVRPTQRNPDPVLEKVLYLFTLFKTGPSITVFKTILKRYI